MSRPDEIRVRLEAWGYENSVMRERHGEATADAFGADVAFLLEDNARLLELLGIAWEIIDRAPWKYAGEVWKRDAAAWSEARSALDADR